MLAVAVGRPFALECRDLLAKDVGAAVEHLGERVDELPAGGTETRAGVGERQLDHCAGTSKAALNSA